MSRAYTVATTALALEMPVKWIDNMLSHFEFSAIEQGRQGRARKVGILGVIELALTRDLVSQFGLCAERAVATAKMLAANREAESWPLRILIDADAHAEWVAKRLELAVESAPAPRRGRPFSKTKRGA